MMASNGAAETTSEEAKSEPRDITNLSRTEEEVPSSTPLEMSSLASKPAVVPERRESTDDTPPLPAAVIPVTNSAHDTTTDSLLRAESYHTTSELPESEPQRITRLQSTAIGPSSDAPPPLLPSKDAEESGPTLLITLLLTNGARHPFRLDSKYLLKRAVTIANNDPFNLSVYKLKELILREWREEWEAKPASPSSIRLISFGKLLDDKAALRESRFNHEAPNVVHMTIKPQDYVEDEDAKAGKGSYSGTREGSERSPGCRCAIM